MANIRTLKLNLLADTTDFAKGIKKATGETDSFSTKVGNSLKSVAKSAALAGVAVGGMAIAFGVDAVKAAAADQKSQKQLQVALKNTTKATSAQVASVEKWITKQQFAYGVSDTKLRPALAKLVRVTGDVTRAQDLLSIAIDVSAGTGKDLETVTGALTRAQQGNLAGLKRLGIPLSDTIIKNKDLAAALQITKDKFSGAAAEGADTFSGKLAIFNEKMGEAKETIGTAILTALQPFAEKWLPLAASGVQHFIDGLLGQNNSGGLKGAIDDNQEAIYNLGQDVQGFFKYLKDNKGTLSKTAEIIAAIFLGAKAGIAIKGMLTALATLRTAFALTTTVAATTAGAEAAATGGASFYAALPAIAAIAAAFGVAALTGIGAGTPQPPKTPKQLAVEAQVTTGLNALNNPVLGLDGLSNPVAPQRSNFRARGATTVINLNGIVDAESARRSIEQVLQSSSVRTVPVTVQGSLI